MWPSVVGTQRLSTGAPSSSVVHASPADLPAHAASSGVNRHASQPAPTSVHVPSPPAVAVQWSPIDLSAHGAVVAKYFAVATSYGRPHSSNVAPRGIAVIVPPPNALT